MCERSQRTRGWSQRIRVPESQVMVREKHTHDHIKKMTGTRGWCSQVKGRARDTMKKRKHVETRNIFLTQRELLSSLL